MPKLVSFSNKKYNIIYADPPWMYRDKASAGKRGASYKYEIPSSKQLEALPVSALADQNCALFLWVTMPKLGECFSIIEKWGFTYKTVAFTWVKKNKKANSWFWGMGSYTRANAELCLLATKGKLERIHAGVHSVVDSPVEQHSKKPDVIRKRIELLFGDLPRIELFARKRFPGWDCLGFDIDGKDIKESLNKIIEKE